MADNVHYFGYVNPIVPTASFGGTGFPFPLGYSTPSILNRFQFALPREVQNSAAASCAKWCLRQKVWMLTTDASAGGVPLPAGPLIEFYGRTREWEIRQQAGEVIQQNSDATFTLSIFRILGGAIPAIWKDGDDYRPSFHFGANMGNEDGGIAISTVESELIDPSEATAVVDGVEMPVYYAGDGIFNFTFLTLTISEFWPYEFAGSPIYDTATGLWLQDPRN